MLTSKCLKNFRPIKTFFAGFQLLEEKNFICDKYFMCVVACLSRPTEGDSFYEYSGISEQRTLWDQYKFKWFVPCIEVVHFMRFQSQYIDRGDKIGDLVLSIVERYLIQCPFLGVSIKRDSIVLDVFRL